MKIKFWDLWLGTQNDTVIFRQLTEFGNYNIFILVKSSHTVVYDCRNERALLQLLDNQELFTLCDEDYKYLWNKEVEVVETLGLVLGFKQPPPKIKEIIRREDEHLAAKDEREPE